MEQSNRVGGNWCSVSITSSWVPHWCAEFDADNFDRVTAKCRIGSRHRYKRNAKRRTLHQEMERAVADLPTYKAGDLLTLKVSSSKLAGRR
jgi:hypothetical protein